MKYIVFSILVLATAGLACSISVNIPTQPVVVTDTPELTSVTVYFMDTARYQVGTEPYETAVTRTVPASDSLPLVVLSQMFLGPTPDEAASGLSLVLSGATGFSSFTVDNGVARLFLIGMCNSNGSTYTIANLVAANLAQFPQIQWIKIYDENGQTETPDGQTSSIPLCLEP